MEESRNHPIRPRELAARADLICYRYGLVQELETWTPRYGRPTQPIHPCGLVARWLGPRPPWSYVVSQGLKSPHRFCFNTFSYFCQHLLQNQKQPLWDCFLFLKNLRLLFFLVFFSDSFKRPQNFERYSKDNCIGLVRTHVINRAQSAKMQRPVGRRQGGRGFG